MCICMYVQYLRIPALCSLSFAVASTRFMLPSCMPLPSNQWRNQSSLKSALVRGSCIYAADTHMWYMPRKGLCLLAVLMPVDLPLFQSYISGVTSVHMPVFAPSVSRTFSQAHPFLGKLRLRYTYKWYTYVRLGAVSTYFASMYVQT